jgi:hypothetical protein
MTEIDIDVDMGKATIVYEDPEGGTVRETVENEYIVYFQDHWLLRHGEDEDGNDLVRRIPLQRVHYVDRNVEEFEDELGTLRNQVESVANDIRSRVFGGREDDTTVDDDRPIEINVESGDDDPDHS